MYNNYSNYNKFIFYKEKMIKMFKKGKTVNEVMESFSYTKQQLAAIKAWVTMGKY